MELFSVKKWKRLKILFVSSVIKYLLIFFYISLSLSLDQYFFFFKRITHQKQNSTPTCISEKKNTETILNINSLILSCMGNHFNFLLAYNLNKTLPFAFDLVFFAGGLTSTVVEDGVESVADCRGVS